MSLSFHLGVVDIPYSQALAAQARRTTRWRQGKRPWQAMNGTQTTGDVAEILEARYGVMAAFYELHGQDIADEVTEVMKGKLESLMMGSPPPNRLFEEGDLSGVEEMFRSMLDRQELDGRLPGVPTGASLRGVNHRMMNPYARRGARPSFIDTGLYQASFRAWVDE